MTRKRASSVDAIDIPEAAWAPEIDSNVTVYPATTEETTGRIVEDFGEFDAHAVEANQVRIADPARRWAVVTTDGHLLFVDTTQLAAPQGQNNPTPNAADQEGRA